MTDNKNINQAKSSYDEMPYTSYSFGYTSPMHLQTIGKLFGMNPPAMETARILELGCASGNNIINFAQSYPKSYSLGIDLSKVEIDHGIKTVGELGLKNIALKHLSITDIDESFGQFDYIICHGVFSWVPEFVREKIFAISKKLLSPEGIAFISYNTLPGWNIAGTIRDMALFHASIFENNLDKVQQGKLFLDFMNESLEGSNSPHAKFLKQETETLRTQEDSYFRHEYLGDENTSFYFHQFMEAANSNGLNYLAESVLSSMFLGNLPSKAAEKLQAINDIVRTEQYMDFIQNRRFRCTLLCHKDINLNRNINAEKLRNFYTMSDIALADKNQALDLENAFEPLKFIINGSQDIYISTSSPIMKAILWVYSENIGNPLKFTEVISKARVRLPNHSIEDFHKELDNSMGRLIFGGYMKIFYSKPEAIFKISTKPQVTPSARYQAKNAHPNKVWITNQINDVVGLQIHEKHIIETLDGKHTKEEIVDIILQKLISGEIVANENGARITDSERLKAIAKQTVKETLEKFKSNFILVG